MRGLRRHEDKHGLDDDRRTLIHRYMVELVDSPEPNEAPPSEQPQEPLEHLTGLVVVESEAAADPTPVPIVFHAVPPEPEQREGGGVSVDAFRQTLEHVARLSAQLAGARDESSRRRAQLTMHS